MLSNIVPAAYRQLVYRVFGAAGLVLGSIQVALLAMKASEPLWLIGALAAYGFATAGTHVLAQDNTPKDPTTPAPAAPVTEAPTTK